VKKVCSRENFLHELAVPEGTEIITEAEPTDLRVLWHFSERPIG